MNQQRARALQQRHAQLANSYKEATAKLEELMEPISRLETQVTENKLVQKELEVLSDEDAVFKLVGPVLIKQDLEEARSNVAKRIEFVSAEMNRVQDKMTTLEKERKGHADQIMQLQKTFERLQQQAVQERLKQQEKAKKEGK